MWKKDLPHNEGEYRLRYLSRNLLVYSNQRALLVNSKGHVIYDVSLEDDISSSATNSTTTTNLAVELFEFGGQIYSCLAKGNKVILYKDYQHVTTLEYTDGGSDNAERLRLKPQQIIFDKKSNQPILMSL